MATTITHIEFESSRPVHKISSFRGAVIANFAENNILFHNHEGESLIYAYPLIQYKSLNGRLAIVGINEGAEAIDNKWKVGDTIELTIDRKQVSLTVCSKSSYAYTPDLTGCAKNSYTLRNWLPFNQENYHIYKGLETLQERTEMLDRLLTGNMLSLYKGLGYWIDGEVCANITEVIKTSTIKYKEVELICFDVKIKTNITLPLFCGIGTGSSKGYGIITSNAQSR